MDGSRAEAAPPGATGSNERRDTLRGRAMAIVFVLLWCSGYPAGKLAVLHGGPFTILLLRFVAAAAIFAALAVFAQAAWPGWRALGHSAVVGLLSLALSFGGIYEGLHLGLSTGVSALFIGAMPLATALFASFAGERLSRWQWGGLALGFVGVLLVLQGRIDTAGGSAAGYLAGLVGLVGLSLGTLYQKRHSSTLDLRVGLAAQHAVAALAMLPLALWVEHFRTDWSSTYLVAMSWIVLINAVGGFALLFALIRRGAATDVATLFYLMPPTTALMGYLVLGERLAPAMLPGFALVAFGIWLGTRREAGA